MQLNVDLLVIIVYLIILVTTGFVFKAFNHDVSDFFRSGAQGTWWLIGASIFMAGVSAATFTGNASVAYEAGLSILWIYIGAILGFILNALFMAAWFRQLRAITFPEVVKERYGSVFQQFYAYVTVGLSMLGAGMMLWALAVFCSAVFDAPLIWTVIILGTVVTVYSVTGGSWAVIATDFLQSLILLPVAALVAILCLVELGGIGGMIEKIHSAGLAEQYSLIKPAGMFEGPHSYSMLWVTAFVTFAIFNSLSMTFSIRYFAAKDGAEAKRAAWFVIFLSIIGLMLWFIPPMTGRLLFASEIEGLSQLNNPADASYAITALNLLPNGMLGLLLVAMFAASMSSIDSGINRNAAILVRDIFPLLLRLFGRPVPDDRKLMRTARWLTLLSGSVVISVALYFSTGEAGMFHVMMQIGAVVTVPLAIPLILGMFIRPAGAVSAFASIFFAAVPAFFSFLISWRYTAPWFESQFGFSPWAYEKQITIISLAGVAGYICGMFFFRRAGQATRERISGFFKKMHTPVDYATEVSIRTGKAQLILLGRLACGVSLMVSLLLFVPNSPGDRMLIAGLAAFIFLVGAGMLLISRFVQPDNASMLNEP